jgi:hypothetical protein
MKNVLKNILLLGLIYSGISSAVIIDFAGGTAYLSNGTSVSTSDTMSSPLYYSNVDYYIEDGVKFDFVGGYGIVGRYYDSFSHPEIENSVIHAHWNELGSVDVLGSMVISMVDGSLFDLNYIDLTSNTTRGGWGATGDELSYIATNSGYSEKLPSSDWGIDYISTGAPGDGIERLLLGNEFDGLLSATFTSENAYCFGLDNFYINEPPPPVPEPAVISLFALGLAGLGFSRRRKIMK